MGNFDHCYQTLGLKPGASMEEVNKAYKSLVVIWHPDRIPKDNTDLLARAEQKLKEINQARDLLRTQSRSEHSKTTHTQTQQDKARRYHPYAAYRAHYEARQAQADSRNRNSGANPNRSNSGNAYQGASADSSAYRPRRSAPDHPYTHYSAYSNAQPASNHTDQHGSSHNRAPETSTDSREPKAKKHQDYYTQSRYNPAYDSIKQTQTKQSQASSASSFTTASPQATNGQGQGQSPTTKGPETKSQIPAPGGSQAQYRPPQPMGYSPPKNYPPPRPPQEPDLSGANFAGHNLREKDLSNRNLSHANLSKADLSDTFLHRINLSNANLEGANLFRANLLEADLSGANMRNVNLIGADLSGCDLRGTDLTGANVGFDGRVMVKITGARLTGAIMPNGKVYEG
jgi:curved DNA-binding protein CbpA